MSERTVLPFETKAGRVFKKAKSLIGKDVLVKFLGVFGRYTILGTFEEDGIRGIKVMLHETEGWISPEEIDVFEEIK